MKALFQTLICCIITVSIYAQKNQLTTNIQIDKTNWITFKAAEQTSAAQLAQNKIALQLQDKDALNLISERKDQLGMRHYRYQQTYNDIPIEGAIYLLHEKGGRVKTANGKLIHELNLNTIPSISVNSALTFALAHVDAELYAWDDPMHENGIKEVKNQPDATFYPSGKLVIIDPEFKQQNTNCKLAYKFDIYAVQPYTRQEVYVDAHNGSIITTIEKIHNCTDAICVGTSNYSDNAVFTACHENGTYTLKNNIGGGMQVFYDNYNGDGTQYSEYPFTSNSNFFQNMPEAVDVHFATQLTRAYFKDTYDRNGLDDNDMMLKSWVHHSDNFNNAAWTGWCMIYGDGDGSNYGSWTTPDIVAHEMTHGITEYSAKLIYQYESGALNESFSDIFGEMVEDDANNGNDWLIGADVILTPGINGLRNMSNPKDPNAKFRQPDTYGGDYWYTGTGDYGGVHINSGVQNYWFYLLSEGGSGTNDNGYTYDINGIGKAKAADIAYHNLTQYLTPTSNYADARAGSIAAAQGLGLSVEEVQTVEDAWCAVGVGCGYTPPNSCIENDSLALVALYNATDGSNWTNAWNLSQPIDTWTGVTLNTGGCVEQLNLYNRGLAGNIPPEIGSLSELENLRLYNNQLNGNIPPEIGNLSNLLYLYLNGNQLTGSIPSEIESLDRLAILSLYDNQLSGNIPLEIGNLNSLIGLYLNDNHLIGSIPPEIGNLGLQNLHLRNNQLSGCYDNDLWYLCNYLYDGNEEISQGNNFEASWEDFCGAGMGSCTSFTIPSTRESDSLALVALYNATDGPNWTNTWDLNQPINTWYGVAVNQGGLVMLLNLHNNDLAGNIPPEIGYLSNLRSMNLGFNDLSGSIPLEIGNLSQIWSLWLESNELSGDIPPTIGALSNVASIRLNYNQLTGNIPFTIKFLSNLQYLSLNNNQLSGNIPPEIGDLSNLKLLNLNYNQLTGNIPINITGLSKLTDLHLGDNQLTGSIPSQIGNLSKLKELWLDYNQLTGNIPSEIGNLNKLEELYIYNNQLSGSIPPEIGNLNELRKLHLYTNNLSGSIPPEIGNLSKLWSLNLNYNDFTGSIPPQIGNLSNLKYMSIEANLLSGNIPVEIGNLSKLIDLSLTYNQLSGAIPSEIGNLSSLVYLYLDDNQLSGNIPSEIGSLSNLTELHLYFNQLSGCYNLNLSNLCSQLISYNISNGNNFDASWDDFCNTGTGSCPANPILPGDFNNDGTANQHDILYWGLAEGYSGATRPNATTDWIPQECPEWDGYINGVNLHHSDGDGDGVIDNNDLSVLQQNFGLTQGFSVPSQSPSSSILGMRQLSKESSGNDIIITYELYLQSNVPISTHGISGSIDLNNIPGILNVSIDTTGSTLRPDAYVYVYDNNQKIANIGLTKTTKNNESVNGSLGTLLIVADDDFQAGDPLALRTNGGSMMSSNGVVTPIAASTLYAVPNSATPDLPVSLSLNHAYCDLGGTATTYVWEGTAPYTYVWSTGANTPSVSNLPIGTHSLTVTDAGGLSKAIDFEVEWAFAPVEVTTSSTQICINFDNVPLAEVVQVSLDNGVTYESPITTNTCYNVASGTHHVWIQRAADQCPVDLGTVTVGSNCTSRAADANLVAIGGKFGQFAEEEFIKNFLTAEKGYIKYQAEIHRILESKDARYTQVNKDFEKIKEIGMAMLFQSFVSKRPVTVSKEHLQVLDNFLFTDVTQTDLGQSLVLFCP